MHGTVRLEGVTASLTTDSIASLKASTVSHQGTQKGLILLMWCRSRSPGSLDDATWDGRSEVNGIYRTRERTRLHGSTGLANLADVVRLRFARFIGW
jgi:hypothetical protein